MFTFPGRVDDGVGKIMTMLKASGISDNTLVIFTSDNGAPLGAQQGEPMNDVLPVGKAGVIWDGSRNDPLTGEKGMLAEGGIRVPMIWSWPARLPQGVTLHEPISSLDIAPSVMAAAHATNTPEHLDGVNLLPWLTRESQTPPKRALYWRFWNQSAIRDGDWKYIYLSDQREYLFNLRDDIAEKQNLVHQNSALANLLKQKLGYWTLQLQPVGLPTKPINNQERLWYRYYFDDLDGASSDRNRKNE